MIKALIVGINDYPSAPLSGCVNDAVDVAGYLASTFGAPEGDVVKLLDHQATKREIITGLHAMLQSSSSGDHLLFHFSGHGTQIASMDPQEPDALDEVLCPVDYRWDDPSSALTDDELRRLLGMVHPNVTMTVVIDACHSGDYARFGGRSLSRRFLAPPSWMALRQRGRAQRTPRSPMPPNAAVISACKPNQVAIDTSFDGRPNGAFTHAFLGALRSGRENLASDVAEASKGVASFAMTPVLESGQALAQAPFLRAVNACGRLMGARARDSSRETGAEVDLGFAGEHHFGGGLFGMSYNNNMSYQLPQGYHRERIEVDLDPPGSGNVYPVRFLSSDPTRGSFEYHVGVSAFWGGRATFRMIARPVVTINNPIVRDESMSPARELAPADEATLEELEVPRPETDRSMRG